MTEGRLDQGRAHTVGDSRRLPRERWRTMTFSSITQKTSRLPLVSKALYRIDHVTSKPGIAVGAIFSILVAVGVGAIFGFPSSWVTAFETTSSAVTLLMVFTIQHTQGREQAATQRKLDELLQATPGASDSLMLLEEASPEVMLETEQVHRELREEAGDSQELE